MESFSKPAPPPQQAGAPKPPPPPPPPGRLKMEGEAFNLFLSRMAAIILSCLQKVQNQCDCFDTRTLQLYNAVRPLSFENCSNIIFKVKIPLKPACRKERINTILLNLLTYKCIVVHHRP